MTNESFVDQLSGTEKASMFLIALGSKAASNVLQHLAPEEVQMLCAQIAKQEKVDPHVQERVVEEFVQRQQMNRIAGGMDYARELLAQALGDTKANELLAEISVAAGNRPFSWLRSSVASRLANFLQNERPQVIALILANLTAGQAAEIMSQLPEDMQGKVAHRLTSMQPVAPEIVRTIEDILRAKIPREGTDDLKAVGGIQSLVTILNNSDRSTENKILEYLEKTEAGVADNVRQMLFAFENIVHLDDRTLQIIIRELEQEDLRLSLKGVDEGVKEAFFRNMSERAAEALKEDIEMLGPVKVRDVEAARRRVVSVIRRLEEAGEISLQPDNEEVIL